MVCARNTRKGFWTQEQTPQAEQSLCSVLLNKRENSLAAWQARVKTKNSPAQANKSGKVEAKIHRPKTISKVQETEATNTGDALRHTMEPDEPAERDGNARGRKVNKTGERTLSLQSEVGEVLHLTPLAVLPLCPHLSPRPVTPKIAALTGAAMSDSCTVVLFLKAASPAHRGWVSSQFGFRPS